MTTVACRPHTEPFLEILLGGIPTLAFVNRNGPTWLQMGMSGEHRCTLCNETLPTWLNLIATPSYKKFILGKKERAGL